MDRKDGSAMRKKGFRFLFLATLAMVKSVAWSMQQEVMMLENFEHGTKQWLIQTKQAENSDLPLAHLATTSLTPPNGGKQAGLFFGRRAGKGEWVSFVLLLEGAKLSARKAQGLTFWWVGDGTQSSLRFVLVAENQGVKRSFKVELSPPQTWQQVKLGWDAFRDEVGTPVTVFVHYLKELRIERSGPFHPFFFILDELAVEIEVPPVPKVSVRVVVDFQQEQATNLLRWGTFWDEKAISLLQDQSARKKIADLRLSWARIFLNESFVSRDFESSAKLVQSWAFQVQRLNMVPVVTLSPLKPEDLPSGAFQQQVNFWVQRLFPLVKLYELFYRPSEPPLQLKPETTAIYFSALKETMKQISPTIQVGGWGERGAWRQRLQILFTKATRPDFFSLHFYGAYNISVSNDELMQAAKETVSVDLPDQVPLNRLDEWLRQLYPPSGVTLQVTECAPIAVRTKDGNPADERVSNELGATWLAAFFIQMAGKGENLVYYKLAGDGWGLLDDAGEPQPTYWSVWACNTYFPTGSTLVLAATNFAPMLLLAGKTSTANNVLLVNTSDKDTDISLEAIGLEKVRTIRIRVLNGKVSPSYAEISPTFLVRVKLPAYGIGVVQFVL